MLRSIISPNTSQGSRPSTTESTVSSPRLRLSPSKLKQFANCGLHYKFTYVDKIPEPPTKHTVLGNIMHRGLELLYQQPQWDRTPERLRALMAQAEAEHCGELEAVFGYGYNDAEHECIVTARDFAQRIFSIEDPSAIECLTEGSLEVDNEDWILRGRYDRADFGPDGITLIDYKSGKPPRKASEREALRALVLYAGMWNLTHVTAVTRVKLVYLRSTPKGKTPVVVSARVDASEIDGGFERVGAMAEAIRHGLDLGFQPKPGVLCHWCPYTALCPAGAAYLEAHPRKVT
jgi:putative RecB family exonuclease